MNSLIKARVKIVCYNTIYLFIIAFEEQEILFCVLFISYHKSKAIKTQLSYKQDHRSFIK